MSVPTVTGAILDQIDEHVRSDLEREVGGILVGSVDGTKATITAAIPALRAVAGSANITFTHEVWDDVLNQVDRDHQGQSIVGWYHSHPGFGVFLSEYDLFIHRNFFPQAAMVALVVDPLRGEAGWFSGTDTITQVGEYAVAAARAPAAQAAAAAEERSNRGTLVLAAAAAVVVAFAIGWVIAPGGDTDDSSAELAAAESRAGNAEERAAAADRRAEELADQLDTRAEEEPQPDGTTSFVAVYTVERGESLWIVAQRYYGDGTRWVEIAEANSLTDGQVEEGAEIVIPGLLDAVGAGALALKEAEDA